MSSRFFMQSTLEHSGHGVCTADALSVGGLPVNRPYASALTRYLQVASKPVGVRLKRRLLVPVFVATAALVFVTAAWAIRFTAESYFPPVGTVGVPYSFTFTGAGGCGPALAYQFTILGGSPPPGLSLAKSGLVSGTVVAVVRGDARGAQQQPLVVGVELEIRRANRFIVPSGRLRASGP